jgi:hypothetical protein
MIARIDRPIISEDVYPNIRSAAGFHDVTTLRRSLLTMASSDEWTIEDRSE